MSRAWPVESMERTGFPGRWLGGAAMLLGPLALLTGVLSRARYHFFFPDQLRGYVETPGLMTAASSCFIAGYVLLWPAVALIVRRVSTVSPGWALWGGMLVYLGIAARAFHAGVDHLAFQLAAIHGADSATATLTRAYPAFHVFHVATAALFFGWIVLAIGAWRARVIGPVSAVALALTSALPIGVLKGTTPSSVVAAVGLCVALLPLGVRTLRDGPRPRPATVARWFGLLAVVLVVGYLLGEAG